jgi:hypothetical protein
LTAARSGGFIAAHQLTAQATSAGRLASRIVHRHARPWAGYPRPISSAKARMAGSNPAMTASNALY